MLSHTSSSWLTAHLRSVYPAIPPHCRLSAPATKSTQIWSIPPFHPSLSILMASLLLASLTIPAIITFLKLAIIWAGVPALAVSALKILLKENIWVPHICQILDNGTLPTVWAPSVIAQQVKVFQWIAFPNVKTKRSHSRWLCRVKQCGDPNMPKNIWEYLSFDPLPLRIYLEAACLSQFRSLLVSPK